ncbi:MAG: DUF2282 domain-containing protein [Thiobacillus sp.]|nr:DUF2282 domain-containing protein [Thiobacillus sp.]
MKSTNRRLFAATALSAAMGIAMAMTGTPASAADMKEMPQAVKDNMARAKANHLVKCYGVSKAGLNDCAEGAHSCVGQSTRDRDPASFVLLPQGDCQKIAGGKTSAS